jgi:tRNA(Ile)-lysidine synthase
MPPTAEICTMTSPRADPHDAGAGKPVDAGEFAAAMAGFAPFEARPALAVAVSGGRDSMALTLLADAWSRAADGTLTALTVDHGLRPEAAAEARHVAGWLADRGIAHRILKWQGPYPQAGMQAAARAARYRLLEDYCARHGILHLLLGHQRDDQIETVRMRRARQSGGAGLSGMAAVRETSRLRLLRPLLAVPRARLAATLAATNQPWLDDPSNENPVYERSRVRAALRERAPSGRVDDGGAAAALRRTDEAATVRAAARCIALFPEGYARIDALAFVALAAPLRRAVLARCVTTIGGKPYAPRGVRLDCLVARLAAGQLGRGRTLGGCRVMPAPGTGTGAWLVVRETITGGGAVALAPGADTMWDGRYAVVSDDRSATGLRTAALGRDGWRRIAGDVGAAAKARLPAPARPSLPALWCGNAIVAVPHAHYGQARGIKMLFAPVRQLGDAGFSVPRENPAP